MSWTPSDEDVSLFRTVWGQDVAGSVLTLIDSVNDSRRRNRQLRGGRMIQLKSDIGCHRWFKGRRVFVNDEQNRIDQHSVPTAPPESDCNAICYPVL